MTRAVSRALESNGCETVSTSSDRDRTISSARLSAPRLGSNRPGSTSSSRDRAARAARRECACRQSRKLVRKPVSPSPWRTQRKSSTCLRALRRGTTQWPHMSVDCVSVERAMRVTTSARMWRRKLSGQKPSTRLARVPASSRSCVRVRWPTQRQMLADRDEQRKRVNRRSHALHKNVD